MGTNPVGTEWQHGPSQTQRASSRHHGAPQRLFFKNNRHLTKLITISQDVNTNNLQRLCVCVGWFISIGKISSVPEVISVIGFTQNGSVWTLKPAQLVSISWAIFWGKIPRMPSSFGPPKPGENVIKRFKINLLSRTSGRGTEWHS